MAEPDYRSHAGAGMGALQTSNAPTLARCINWVSTAVLKAASSPASTPTVTAMGGTNVPIPAVPEGDPTATGVW